MHDLPHPSRHEYGHHLFRHRQFAVLLVEATRVADVQAIRREALSAAALERSGWVEQAFGTYSLMYEVSAGDEGSLPGDRA